MELAYDDSRAESLYVYGLAPNTTLPPVVQLPAVTNARAPVEVIVQTPVVDDVNVGVDPDDAVAVTVGVVPKFCAPGFVNVIVWPALGVTALDALESTPVPAEFVAVAVNV